ncbi:MAG TPA: caspase family protein [Gammaproteobacteria bacterium]|nr:caspase family protein [Gammaproteobacteria bacterium]
MTATHIGSLGVFGLLLALVQANAQAPEFGDDSSTWALDGECDDPRFSGQGVASVLLEADRLHDATDCRTLFERGLIHIAGEHPNAYSGSLQAGDSTLPDGEYFDTYSFHAQPGQHARIDLRSAAFDTYLFVVDPNGDQQDNDDFDGNESHSALTLAIEHGGTYKVYATSYAPGESGEYSLEISVMDTADFRDRAEPGSLSQSDRTLDSGEFYDSFNFVADAGKRYRVNLNSNDFDTYLIVVPPDGEQFENDDGESTSHSFVDIDAEAFGLYRVLVTSYEQGETGDYLLTIEQHSNDGQSIRDAPPQEIVVDADMSGALRTGDSLLNDGEYGDLYSFEATAGQAVRVELRSEEFDTYLALMTPSEAVFQNDDFEGSTTRSAVELIVPDTGTYTIIATSYAAGETGQYALSVTEVDPASLSVAQGGGRVYGLFAGISDYPGKEADLAHTAEDPVRLRDAMIAGAGLRDEDQITLVDSHATRSALRLAIEDIAGRIQPEDTFVFFFSGHGDRIERPDGPQITDPDALDETIELYDGSVSDDELRDMLSGIVAGTSLIFLDSCFSGGFAKDLISVPGRMGLFSSEEDVTSSVAAKFEAGGYLSVFLADAIRNKLADSDGDNAVTAIELSQYVHERYRADVKLSSSAGFERTGAARTGHQRLVVDRGSIGPYDILFR